ncbi:MAG: sialate O-acetylesterase [Phycisphaeraceae bacterium]
MKTSRSLIVLFVSLCLLGAPHALADTPASEPSAPAQPPAKEDVHVYLLIGQSNMAGRAKVPAEIAGVLDRAYLLDKQNQWTPAKNPFNLYSTIRKGEGMQKLGPGYAFAQTLLEANPDATLGLVVNARGGSRIEQWLGQDARYYRELLKRARAATKIGTLKGVLWHQGEANSADPDDYAQKLNSLIAQLRKDLGDERLPFVAGQIRFEPHQPINDIIADLPESVPHTAVASSKGLTTYDKWHFDTESQLQLGKRYAEAMLRLHHQATNKSRP